MKITIDITHGSVVQPKRGDLLHTNVGDRRERTCLIVAVHRLKPRKGVPRFKVWAERWWQVEVDLRCRLFRSAERNGGQALIYFARYPAKKKRNDFEGYMRDGMRRLKNSK